MTALEQAKERLPLPKLMARLGLGEHARKSARCPFHDDRSNSFSVFQKSNGKWAWNCFAGCGGGDEAAFLARIDSVSSADGCRKLIELSGARASQTPVPIRRRLSTRQEPPNERIPTMPDAVAQAWTEGVDYILAQGASAQRLAEFRGWPVEFASYVIGCAAVSLPLSYNERGIAFQVVAPEGTRGAMTTRPVGYHIRLKGKPGHKASWFFLPNDREHNQSIPALPYILGDFETASLLVVTEGQWDALTFALAAGWIGDGCLWPRGVGLIGIRGASGVTPFLRWYERFWPEHANCLLLADADKAGGSWSEGERCFARQLAWRCARVAVVDCYPHKDFNDLYRAEKPGKDEIAELLSSHGMAVESEVMV
jgi:hypothetical protein